MLKLWMPRLALVLMIAAGCSGDRESASADTSFNPPPVATAVPSHAVDAKPASGPCPHTGLWAQCSVEKRLRQAGFVVKLAEGEAPARSGFSMKPVVMTLGQSRIEVFIYRNEKALAADIAKLDTVTVARRGSTANWESPPTFIRSGNLIAIVLSQNPRQAERVALALTAGAPQPGSPR